MKISFISTVYNEGSSIKLFLNSLFNQSKFPDEIIIVDGGSTDNTISEISNFQFPPLRQGSAGQANSKIKTNIKLIFKKGNRSVGRNEAIKNATSEIIACSDAGCVLDKDWIKNIIGPFSNPKTDVVAGYYRGIAKTVFQKCLIPYVLVMPDKVDHNNFLPATRSMAFRKKIWEKVGKFPEEFSNNEDYVFAKKLKASNARIVFEKKAIVDWAPRNNMKEAFNMFYRFAKGDAEAGIFRPKVSLIFLRYIIGLLLVIFYLLSKSYLLLNTLYLILFTYNIWAIVKNYGYVRSLGALFYLPILQMVSDIAVMLGTTIGIFSSKKRYNK